MKDLNTVSYHPISEMMVDILSKSTQKLNHGFFHVQVAYYLGKLASMMRCNVYSVLCKNIPVNIYALNLAPSGSGKGHSTNIIEGQLINGFKENFMGSVFEEVRTKNLANLAVEKSLKTGQDPDEILKKLETEYRNAGQMFFSFDSATTAAVKQLRHKLLLSGIGSICLEIDEIGSNLVGNTDVINTFLELYDVGKLKPKLTKNTNENIRNEDLDGSTPANTLWFGTPAKLFDGGKIEEVALEFFETGYARRCLINYTPVNAKMSNLTAKEITDMLSDPTLQNNIDFLHRHFTRLADASLFNQTITLPPDVEHLLIEYKQECEAISDSMKDHEEVMKAEIAHRYFKVLKLAAIYAFIDGASSVSEENLYAAIKLVEECGKSFKALLNRDGAYVKLAKFISDIGTPVTHADLVEKLPYYRGTAAAKAELLSLAISWGYKNLVIIKRYFESGVEFLHGETVKVTDTSKMIISYSRDIATGYTNKEVNFSGMKNFLMRNDYHFINHHTSNGNRVEDSIVNGFNMVIIDVDGTATLQTAQLLLKDYRYIMYTTKSHQTVNNEDRFRIILPLSHVLKLDGNDFKEFMNNIYEWLPFEVDTQTSQRSRKWRTWNGDYYENQSGELFDVMPFIPKTTQNEERKKIVLDTQNLTNLERWFVQKTGRGNRNSQLHKYAMLLVDSGMDYKQVFAGVQQLNIKTQDPITDDEIADTIMVTVQKKLDERA